MTPERFAERLFYNYWAYEPPITTRAMRFALWVSRRSTRRHLMQHRLGLGLVDRKTSKRCGSATRVAR